MEQHKQNPMPLEELPEYLKSRTGGSPLVSVGQIVMPKKRSYMKWSLAMVMLVTLGLGGMTTYNAMSTEQLTVVMDVDDPQAISQIIADSGGRVLSVKHTEDSTYEVEVTTRKSRLSFLDWLRKNKDVKKAEFGE